MTNADTLASLTQRLSIADDPTSTSESPAQAVDDGISSLLQLAHGVNTQIQAFVNRYGSATGPSTPAGIPRLYSARRTAIEISRLAEQAVQAMEEAIVGHIIRLGDRDGGQIPDILSHFDNDIRDITRELLDQSTDDTSVIWKIAESCYKEAVCTSGRLHSDQYWDLVEEACLEPPSGSDEYQDWRDKLKAERREWEKERWVGFWVEVLQKTGGATLFYPPRGHKTFDLDTSQPRYLFRAFDFKSGGVNNDCIIASVQVASGNNAVDLLSLTEDAAVQRLHSHLNSARSPENNLVSWSSSLVFVIQYAIYKCYRRRMPLTDIRICVVETSKFPSGQFVRDMVLLQRYRDAARTHPEAEKFFKFRLGWKDYDNGEYLSQGTLHHKDRSCLFSLDDLVKAGLYTLFPEFAESKGRYKWTNRVKELRNEWYLQQETTKHDVRAAFNIARRCFSNFEAADIALMLLMFKDRRLKMAESQDEPNAPPGLSTKQQQYGPVEVQRYEEAFQALAAGNSAGFYDTKSVEDLFGV
ncbi:hypothetical protein ACHAPT_009453 [Fusarium lateritium]